MSVHVASLCLLESGMRLAMVQVKALRVDWSVITLGHSHLPLFLPLPLLIASTPIHNTKADV